MKPYDPNCGFTQSTHDLIEKMCELVERKDYELKKEEGVEYLMQTYDLFNLSRPKKVVWYVDVFDKDFEKSAWSAGAARAARSAWSAGAARSAWSAGAVRAAWSVGAAWSAGAAGAARLIALDYDFDWFVVEHEYCKTNTDWNKNDKKYLEYSELLLKAVECGIGYRVEWEDTLYIVPAPLILIDEQNRFHSQEAPAIQWKGGKEFFYLWGVNLPKALFDQRYTISAKEIIKIENIEQRMVLLKIKGAEKLLEELNAKLVDGKTENGNELYSIDLGTAQDEKMLKYSCPSTDRVYTKFVPPEFIKADEAQSWSHNFTMEQYFSLKAQS